MKLTEIGNCEQWSVISRFEASTLLVLGRDHTILLSCVRIIIFMHVHTERINTIKVHELGSRKPTPTLPPSPLCGNDTNLHMVNTLGSPSPQQLSI